MWRALPSGEVAEWLKAADCKSARASVRWFESSPLHHRRAQAVRGTGFGLERTSEARGDLVTQLRLITASPS